MLMTADNLSPLNVPHAFFLRGQENGATEGIYRGLNCGFGSDDDAETVKANRAAAMAALGFSGDALETLHQVHSARVVRVTEPGEAAGRRADALVTASPGVVLGILTADCAPILFYDPDAKVAGAAHAGWRGARVRCGRSNGSGNARARSRTIPHLSRDRAGNRPGIL